MRIEYAEVVGEMGANSTMKIHVTEMNGFQYYCTYYECNEGNRRYTNEILEHGRTYAKQHYIAYYEVKRKSTHINQGKKVNNRLLFLACIRGGILLLEYQFSIVLPTERVKTMVEIREPYNLFVAFVIRKQRCELHMFFT